MIGMMKLLLGLFVGAAVVYAAVLTVNSVVNWFRNRAQLVNSDKDNIAFTIRESLSSGKFAVYQGVFNTRTEQLLEGVKNECETLDSKLASLHAEEPMVIYQ